ncbi:ATP-grasp domain-containing protein [Nocardioides dokdonensis]|uniref:ATP-grasp domain-containing protein n=1 Tax=Nocardioides dokdonensis TaxID=450734 RepID=UPI000832A962|nr:ATP-grasp domain-containing protein [Nocardioides dokdonensis]
MSAADPSPPAAGAPRRALVVEGGATHVLAAARCLARAGWEVGVATAGGRPRTSRAVRRCHQVPPAEVAPDAWVDAVAGLVAQHGYDVVFGADDIEVLLLSARRADIGCVVPHCAHDDVLRAIDKLELVRVAESVGLGVPRTEEATASTLAAVDGPVVVKARLHWDPAGAGEARHLLAEVCSSAADATRAAGAMTDGGGVPLLQEALDGGLSALSLVRDRGGRVLGVVQQRSPRLSRRRTSCRAVTVPVDVDLLAGVERLLDELGWWGLANLQFLTVPGDRPRLIDLNGRFYGSLALAVASGVPLPDLWGRTALGEVVEPVPAARVGVRFQSFFEDLSRARLERRGGLVRDVASTVAHLPGAAHPHADLRDPGPGLRLLRDKVVRRG